MSGPVLVLVAGDAGAPSRAALQAIGAARGLAEALGVPLEGVATADVADAARRYLPHVHRVEAPPHAAGWTAVLAAAQEARAASAVVLSATRSGAAVAPRVAVRTGGALLEDVVTLAADGGAVVGDRLAHLQRVRETVRATAAPAVVTTKVGAFAPADPAAAEGEVADLPLPADPAAPHVTVERTDAVAGDRVPLEEAPVVVTGGRGLGGAEAFDAWVVPLADALGGAVGATRAAVDAGWRPYDEQIGQTGRTVAPDVYLSLGVSGAVQHLSGMNRSGLIVAVDHDPDAPIFAHCDVGVVADAHAFAPALLAALKD